MTETTKTPRERYEEFLLKEYDNIAQAHFNTVSTISTFFKHYLLIISLPLPVLAVVAKEGDIQKLLQSLGVAVPIAAVLIALVGLLVMCYVVNLRFDVLLYARTVNGVRKDFEEMSGLTSDELAKIKVLPTNITQPSYFESHYFLFVVFAFAVLDSAYPFAAFLWWVQCCTARWGIAVLLALVSLAAHIVAYWWLSQWREEEYLK